MAVRIGQTKSIIRLRYGPAEVSGLAMIVNPQTPVEILAETGDWLRVRAKNTTGYVRRELIELPEPDRTVPEPEPGGEDSLDPFAALGSDPDTVQLEAPEGTGIEMPADAPYYDRMVASIWNRFGGLLTVLARADGVDPGVPVAILTVESGGFGFGPDQRMVIRFEHHIFHSYWGQHNQKKFDKHFRFDPVVPYTGHTFRVPGQGWKTNHVRNQSVEWEAFELAAAFSLTAARLSISMGSPQIMGFNYSLLNYGSVHDMFLDFSSGDRPQLIGFYNFARASQKRLKAMQDLDFTTIAAFYNGTGQKEKYGKLIQGVFEKFKSIGG
jgi:hypothetical protein